MAKHSFEFKKKVVLEYLDGKGGRSCPEKWCKQAFQVFKRSAVIS